MLNQMPSENVAVYNSVSQKNFHTQYEIKSPD